MSAVFTWLDQSEQQRRKVLDIVALFKQRETVDELGLGTIRDGFSDLLFPGTSAPQTRARYFLFIPWMYLQFEQKEVKSSEIKARATEFELKLIEKLLASGESDGVIGKNAGRNLKRLPSGIYWSGLIRLGILSTDTSQDRYQASLDAYYARPRELRNDDGEATGIVMARWHRKLPKPPEGWSTKPSLALTREEAEFLRDQVTVNAPDSLFAAMLRSPEGLDKKLPWDDPAHFQYSREIAVQLRHAQNFSEVMHGAALVYNLILAELTNNDEREAEYQQLIAGWSELLKSRHGELAGWELADLWSCVTAEGARVGLPTRQFVTEWCRLAIADDPASAVMSVNGRTLIIFREKALKGRLARVVNQQARERWGGAAGTGRLDYRWPNARRIAVDIVEALEGKLNA